jgi:hypothetical protein
MPPQSVVDAVPQVDINTWLAQTLSKQTTHIELLVLRLDALQAQVAAAAAQLAGMQQTVIGVDERLQTWVELQVKPTNGRRQLDPVLPLPVLTPAVLTPAVVQRDNGLTPAFWLLLFACNLVLMILAFGLGRQF